MPRLTKAQVQALVDELETTSEALELHPEEALEALAYEYGFELVPYLEDGGW